MTTAMSHTGNTATALICSPDPVFCDHLAQLLHSPALQYHSRYAATPEEALQLAIVLLPRLVIVEHRPPDLDGISLAGQIRKQLWTPVLLAAQTWDKALLKIAVSDGVAAFITRFPGESELRKAIFEAEVRLDHDDLLAKRLREVEQKLSERKVIEKAKGLLMERDGINENEAFKVLRSQSMARRISMAKLAEEIIR